MKSLNDFNHLMVKFEDKFGIGLSKAEQGSTVWHQAKLGVISASNASRAVAKKDSDTRWTYLYELAAQVATGVAEEINSKYLDFGMEHEGSAVALYELHERVELEPVPFVFKDAHFRCGCSPDRWIPAQERGLELKVPFNAVNYVRFLCEDKLKPEYQWQVDFSMWVTGATSWSFANYSPLMKVKPIHIITVPRNEERMKMLDDLIPAFIHDYDEALKQMGLKYGDQWERLKK